MKFYTLALIIILNSCGSNKKVDLTQRFSEEKKINATNCPDNGLCTVAVFKNKSLSIAKDGIGKLYPKIKKGNNTVIVYTYKKSSSKNYADGNQSETIHFEINQNSSASLKNADLQKIKLIYGKHCFNRDIAGYYAVRNGKYLPSKKSINIEFEIPIIGESQILKKIEIVLK